MTLLFFFFFLGGEIIWGGNHTSQTKIPRPDTCFLFIFFFGGANQIPPSPFFFAGGATPALGLRLGVALVAEAEVFVPGIALIVGLPGLVLVFAVIERLAQVDSTTVTSKYPEGFSGYHVHPRLKKGSVFDMESRVFQNTLRKSEYFE